MNNLLVHISLSWDPMSDFTFGRFGIRLLSNQTSDFAFGRFGIRLPNFERLSKHCAMKVDLSSGAEIPQNHKKFDFIVTHNELPGLCRSLLWMENLNPGCLASTKLKLITADDVGTDGARATKDKIAKGHNEKTIGTTSSRVRRLLEPFRRLHSMKDLHITGPLSDIYKSEVIADMGKPPPSNEDLCNRVFISLEKAFDKFDNGDFASSIPEFLNTLDELDDAATREHRIIDFNEGFFTECCDACLAIDFVVWTELAWAYLRTGDINNAENWLFQIVRRYTHSYCGTRLRGHQAIMISHLDSQILEKLSVMPDPTCDFRFYYPLYLRKLLKEKLRHEPENELLVQELEKQEAEVAMKSKENQSKEFATRNIWYWHTNLQIEEW